MVIRAKWVRMADEDKCQYNGYNDFFKKESEKMKREEIQGTKDKEENIVLQKKRHQALKR